MGINNGVKNIQAKAKVNIAKGNALTAQITTFFQAKPVAPAAAAAPAPAAAAKPAAPVPAAKVRRLVSGVNKGISELESFFEGSETKSKKRRAHRKLKSKKHRMLKKKTHKKPKQSKGRKLGNSSSTRKNLKKAKSAALKAAKAASDALNGKSSSKLSFKGKKSGKDFDKIIAGDFDIKNADKSIEDLTKYWNTAKAGIAKSKQFKDQVMKKIAAAKSETNQFLTKISTNLKKSGKAPVAPKPVAAPAKAAAPAPAAPAKAAPAAPAKAAPAAAPAKLRRLISRK